MLRATIEAPPKMAAVRPRQVGMIEGLTIDANPINGAAETPRPKTPRPNMALRKGLLTETMVLIFYF